MNKEKKAANLNLNLFLMVPVLFSIHNFEEAYTMANWLPERSELFRLEVTVSQFSIAVAILSIIGIFVTAFAKYMLGGKYFVNIMCGFSAILFLNAFFPHIFAALYLKTYVPGVLTAIFLYAPFCSFLFYSVLSEKIIERKSFAKSFIAGAVVGVLSAKVALCIGGQF